MKSYISIFPKDIQQVTHMYVNIHIYLILRSKLVWYSTASPDFLGNMCVICKKKIMHTKRCVNGVPVTQSLLKIYENGYCYFLVILISNDMTYEFKNSVSSTSMY